MSGKSGEFQAEYEHELNQQRPRRPSPTESHPRQQADEDLENGVPEDADPGDELADPDA